MKFTTFLSAGRVFEMPRAQGDTAKSGMGQSAAIPLSAEPEPPTAEFIID